MIDKSYVQHCSGGSADVWVLLSVRFDWGILDLSISTTRNGQNLEVV